MGRGLSGRWPRWMTRGTWREARTQGALICRYIGATEDAASRRVTPVRRPGPFPGQAPNARSRRSRRSSRRRPRRRERRGPGWRRLVPRLLRLLAFRVVAHRHELLVMGLALHADELVDRHRGGFYSAGCAHSNGGIFPALRRF